MARIYASSGGGIRIGATFGALLEGEHQQRFSPLNFDYYTGTSAGALDAALTANGWSAEQKCKMFLNTDFGALFTAFGLPYNFRKALALKWPIPLKKLEGFYQSLCEPNPFGPAMTFAPGIFINTVDAEENINVIYCHQVPEWVHTEKDPKTGKIYSFRLSHKGAQKRSIRWEVNNTRLATAMMRSAVLPGLIGDDPRYMDGGISENPFLSLLPKQAEIFLMHLGYAGLIPQNGGTTPKSILERLLYSYEFKNYSLTEHMMEHFDNLTAVYPKVYDVDISAFNMSRTQKQKMLTQARENTVEQWSALGQ